MTNYIILRRFSWLALTLAWLPSTVGADPAIRVVETTGSSKSWTVAQTKETLAADVRTIEVVSHGQKQSATAVPLLSVLQASGAPVALKMEPKASPHIKNANLRLVVVIQSADGYVVSFSLAELMPELGGREAWIAFEQDGKPLSPRDGLMKLIVPGDQKPGRWVRDIATIAVVDPSPVTNQATKP